jgi:hypothetical protein
MLAVMSGAGLAEQEPTLALAGGKSGMSLSITADRVSYGAGEPISIAARFENVSDHPIQVLVARPDEVFCRFSVVRMENANSAVPAKLTPFGKERLDPMRHIGTSSWMLPRGEALKDSLEISPWYLMPPGTYKIACYIDMPTDRTFLSRLRYISN